MIRALPLRHSLMISVATLAIGIALPAAAQDLPADDKEAKGDGNEIIVTGARLQNQKAISTKRDSVRILDAVASDEIGSLPDDNAGEALQRIPGISIQTDQAEARFAAVRALNPNLNFTTVDGNIIASPDRGGRQIFLDVLPSSLAKRIEVVKSFTPDLDGEAIGGHINFVSRSAFDYKGDTFVKAYARIGTYENNEGFNGSSPSGKADLVLAHKFGADKQWGILLAADYYLRDSYIPQIENGSRYNYYARTVNATTGAQTLTQVPFTFTDAGRVPSGGRNLADLFPVPDERRWFDYHNNRQRYGASLKLDFQPTDSFSASLKGYYHTARDEEVRQASIASNPVPTLITSPTTGTVRAQHRFEVGQFHFERTLWGGQLILENKFDNGQVFSFNTTYSGTYFNNPESFTEFRNPSLIFDYDTTNRIQTWNPQSPASYFNYENYTTRKYELNTRSLREDIFEGRIDFGRNWEGQDEGLGYRLGGKARWRARSFEQDRDLWNPAVTSNTNPAFISLRRFLGPVSNNVPGARNVATPDTMITIDTAAFNSFFASTMDDRAVWTFDPQTNVDEVSDYSFDEWNFAGYGLLSFRGERFFILGGARYERTEFEATGRGTRTGVTGFVDTASKGSYGRLLPSVNASFDVIDNVRLRAAYSRSLGRPRFDDLAPRGQSIDTRGTTPVVSRSNPDLKPRQSDNFDFTAEWYFDGGEGIFSVGAFYKNIKNEFFTVRQTQTLDIGNGPQDVLVTQPINLSTPVKIKGVEFNFVKNLNFLPAPLDGFGVSFNGTLLDPEWQVPNTTTTASLDLDKDGLLDIQPYRSPRTLRNSANYVINASLFYDKGPVSGRIAYTRTGIQLDGVTLNEPERDNYWLPIDKVDLQLGFKLSKHLKLGFEVQNLTNSGRQENIGLNQELVQTGIADFGRAYFFSITFKN